MISGVKIKNLKIWKDQPDLDQKKVKPGHLMEVLRADDRLLKKFGQTTFTLAHPGTIKAFHWHKQQDDLWFFATGKATIVLYDTRKKSKTFGQTQIIECNAEKDPKLVLIPIGVAHGYKAQGKKPVSLFYHTTKPYNPKKPDEQRIPYNDKSINFNWAKIK